MAEAAIDDLQDMKAALPAGPTEHSLKQTFKMGVGIYDYLWKNYQEFGDAFTLDLSGMDPMVWVNTPAAAKDFFKLRDNQLDQTKLPIPVDIGDNQTGFLNNEEHQHSRKVVIPNLVTSRLKDRADVMQKILDRHIDSWKVGDTFDMPRLIGDITLDITCYTLMNQIEGPEKDRYKDLMNTWIQESTSDKMFILGNIYGPAKWRNFLYKQYLKKTAKGDFGHNKKGFMPWSWSVELKAQLADLIRQDIRKIRSSPDQERQDMLYTVAKATYDNGELLPEERVISEAMGMLVAGHETSAATAGWFMLQLLKSPESYNKLRAEVLENVAENGGFDPLKIVELPYVNACLNESQRLTPSAVGTMRHLINDTKIGDNILPAGTNVLANAYVIHRRKDVWGEDALEYKPERWLEGKRPTPWEFFPFGGGARACVGMNQAKQQLRIIFAEFARRVEWDSPYANNDEWPGQIQVSGQTEAKGGVPVTVTKIHPKDVGIQK